MTQETGNSVRQLVGASLRVARRLVACATLVATLTLFHWSRIDDPRFYAFLDTDTGAALARVFGWYASPMERPSVDKTDDEMTAEERSIKAKIEELLGAEGAERNLRVTYRDVTFCMEVKGMTAHVAPPYLILTDGPPEEVPSHVDALACAHEGFRTHFGRLTTGEGSGQLSHVLLFSDPADYLAYQQQHATGLENSCGFYSPIIDRLVLYEHPNEDSRDVESETLHTVRHEGAHQFLYAHGVHSRHRVENDWLVEGMATYLETSEAGAVAPDRANMIAYALRNERAIPLEDLVGRRQEEGLLAYKPAELAYSEAWSLVHFLMQEERRDQFFDYVVYLRDAKNFGAIRKQPRLGTLAGFLGLSPTELRTQWEAYVQELAAGAEYQDATWQYL